MRPPTSKPRRSRRIIRRGFSVLLVLLLLMVTLSLSYAMLRTEANEAQVQRNFLRQAQARQATEAGLSAALREMSQANWAGVDSTLTRSLSTREGFSVRYTTGDDSLAPGDADWTEFPFRVTLSVEGYCHEPGEPHHRSTATRRAVVQLVRRRLTGQPSGWNHIQPYTLHQWGSGVAEVQFPVRIEGRSRWNAALRLLDTYPNPSAARQRYLTDLELMRQEGLGDHRPFHGPLEIRASDNGTVIGELRNWLGLSVSTFGGNDAAPVSHPGVVNTYRLFPGGKTYVVPDIPAEFGSNLANRVLAPEMKENPLGVFRTSSTITLQDDVFVQGTLIASGSSEVRILGNNVRIVPPQLPPLWSDPTARRMPAVISAAGVQVQSGSASLVRGAIVTWDDFTLSYGSAATAFDFRGILAAREVRLLGRANWNIGAFLWQLFYNAFLSQHGGSHSIDHFPRYMQAVLGMQYAPQLTLRAGGSEVNHWHDWSQPVYRAAASEGGLRWELLRSWEP